MREEPSPRFLRVFCGPRGASRLSWAYELCSPWRPSCTSFLSPAIRGKRSATRIPPNLAARDKPWGDRARGDRRQPCSPAVDRLKTLIYIGQGLLLVIKAPGESSCRAASHQGPCGPD